MARVVQSSRSREPYWRLVVTRWKRSGLSVRTFCQAEGLNQATFYWWRRELNRRDQPKPAFLPVRVLIEKTGSSAAGLEVVLNNGRRVRVDVGFDARTLAEIVEVLEEGGASC